MLTLIFTYLYPLLSISTIAGYLPQIKEFIITSEAPKGFAVSGWVIWLCENFITIGYGAVVLQDLTFCLMTSLDMFLIAATIFLAIRAKQRFERAHGNGNEFKIDFVRAALC